MALRAIWSGGISFGLVFIPVKLYSAINSKNQLSMDLLREKDNCPIKYVRVCSRTGEEVPWDDIVKGYEYKKGDYIILSDEDFEQAAVKRSKSIDIVKFVKQEDIDAKYIEKPYFIEPKPEAAKTYLLLREALKKSKKVGIAKYVLRSKEHLGMLRVENDLIYLNQLRFAEDVREPDEIEVPEGKISKGEIEMALKLIEQISDKFDPTEYKDTYKEELRSIIEEKAKGKKTTKKKAKEKKPTEANDLMDQLKKSLEAMT